MRAGFDAVRRGAGDDAFLLGCGVPLSNVVGVVDGNRIGADVAPSWNTVNFETAAPGYERALPATVHSWQNTLARSFMHRKLWLNDPDCLMLRQSETQMTPGRGPHLGPRRRACPEAWRSCPTTWPCSTARPERCSTRSVALGRDADAEAVAGLPARCPDLMAHAVPRELLAVGRHLEGDPAVGTSVLRVSRWIDTGG